MPVSGAEPCLCSKATSHDEQQQQQLMWQPSWQRQFCCRSAEPSDKALRYNICLQVVLHELGHK